MVSRLLPGLRYPRLWWVIGAGLVALVAYLSLTPEPIDSGDVGGHDPGHFIAYLTLMLWFAQLLRPGWGRVVAAVALVGLGVGLEFAQGLTTWRTFDVADMLDDGIGVAVGFLLAMTPLGGALAALERRLGAAAG